jgi:hypothetical protein
LIDVVTLFLLGRWNILPYVFYFGEGEPVLHLGGLGETPLLVYLEERAEKMVSALE